MKQLNGELEDLRERISELQALTLIGVAETNALKELSMIIWESQKVEIDQTRTIDVTLQKMREGHLERLLSSFADLNMKAASTLRQNIDRFSKGKEE